MFYLIVRSLAIFLFKILFRLQVFGKSNLPLKGGLILAANHSSYLDPPVLGAACPRMLYFLAKEELFRVPFLGSLIANLNTLPIQTPSGDLRSFRLAIRKLKQGEALIIFPEGRRTTDGKLTEPMKGIGLLATKAEVPIVPAFIQGSHQALPVHSKFIRLKKIKVYFGQAFWPDKLNAQLNKKDFYREIATKTIAEIKRLEEHAE